MAAQGVVFATPHIPGLSYFPEFLSEEELDLLSAVIEAGPRDASETLSTGRPLAATPGVHWHGFPRPHGWDRSCGDTTEESPLPRLVVGALARLQQRGALPEGYAFDQAIVNCYPEGAEGIPMHVDRATFDDVIVGFSLGAPAVIDFEPLDARKAVDLREVGLTSGTPLSLVLEERSVYIFSGEVRWQWKHGIRQGPHRYNGVELPGGQRISVTLRRMKRQERRSEPGDPDTLWLEESRAE
ncbi:unnamed protein product, partial [Polarella glacialis]